MNPTFTSELRELSLTARSALGLLIVEEYLRRAKIQLTCTEEYLDYLWGWPLVNDFESWEKNRPFLVNYALGDTASDELKMCLKSKEIEEQCFRSVVTGPVEVLWGSFWGAAEGGQSYQVLVNAINASGLEKLPVLTPLKFSMFIDKDGWGKPVSRQDRDFWRENVKYA